jgi:hypothetical protein
VRVAEVNDLPLGFTTRAACGRDARAPGEIMIRPATPADMSVIAKLI